ncbi:MACPF domain-containing protein NSL1 isoform X2 [Hevea brasiliensis]|uniref:MACPF domain-containing protein NSL1 isoform X2 n=1 Tax=Hevea brasiliensis TaxID=3981 RepID=UPI0025E7A154|nr:MACPF domain-containing protein NSL1 isoform X2 [Hevea brasiliensis]
MSLTNNLPNPLGALCHSRLMALHRLDPQSAAEKAISVIGFGYDLTRDVRLSACKPGPSGSRLIEFDPTLTRELVVPGGIVVRNVSTRIKCDKGERTRFRSGVLSFNQMSEKFNQDLSLSELQRSHLALSEQLKQEVPTSWDAAALAEFIEKYGTHIVVGVKMGGKDVIHIKQLQKSNAQPPEIQKLLKQVADERFSDKEDEHSVLCDPCGFATSMGPTVITPIKNEDILSISVRRGGVDIGQSHYQWLPTISQSPNVISMSFVPVTSLLGGVRGNGFLSHAVNLYLRYKPSIEELHQFLEFQLPRQWAPEYGDLPLTLERRKQASPSLQFTFMGPKLYVNTMQVDSGNRPVTGIRLYLEGKRSDRLAIHLQHLSILPSILQLSDDHRYETIEEPVERGYVEPVKCSIFSHVCTAPVRYNGPHIDDSASIVSRAWFEVKIIGMKKVLFLRLGFSMVASARIRRSEWDGPSTLPRKSGVISMLISTRFSAGLNPPPEKPVKVDVNSAVFHGDPPSPTRAPKMSNFVDTKEIVRGPDEAPGYWVVTGAKLCVEGGRISIKVKYSLLAIMSEESMMLM